MGMGGGPTNWTRKRNGFYTVTEAAPFSDELTSRAVLFEQDVEVWSGPVRSGPNRRTEVRRDLDERKAHDEDNRTT